MNFQKQKGVALVVGLIMLLVLTIMGISSMSNTTQELKIACNFQNHNDAFQNALSCVDYGISKTTPGADYPLDIKCEITGANGVSDVAVDYLGCRVGHGSSLKSAAYENVYGVDVSAVANGCGGEAFSHIVQAVAIKTPRPCAEE